MTIAFIGIGGAGGNLADLASEMGLHAGTINFSQGDLNSLQNIKYKLKLIGSDGVGHDRQLAIQLVSEHYETVLNFIKDHFNNESIIFVPFSTGGGTGSGITPLLLDLLSTTMEDKTFVAMPIIPDKTESLTAQINTLQVFEELSNQNVCILPIDNNQIKLIHKPMSKKELYDIANNSVIQYIELLTSYTNRFSQHGTFDKRDLHNALKTKGIALISHIYLSDIKSENGLTKDSLTKHIHHSWHYSPFIPIEEKQIIKAAFIFDGNLNDLHAVDYNDVFSTFNNQPIDLFEGIYEGGEEGVITTLLTGLSWCHTRLKEIEEIVQLQKQAIDDAMNNMSEQQTFKSSVTNILAKINKPIKKKESPLDILSKYKR